MILLPYWLASTRDIIALLLLPGLASATGKLLVFEIEVDGNVFSMRDDVEFPDLPMIEAEEGVISFVDYDGKTNTGARLRVDGGPGEIARYIEDLGNMSSCYLSNLQVVATPVGCPDFNTIMVNAAWLAID